MNYSNNKNIFELPDEILCIIFRKLNIVDVLYSLVDINQRFDRLAFDPHYIHDLDMTTIMTSNNSTYNRTFSIDTRILSRICQKILPRIDHQIHKLTVDECSMKPSLDAGNYSQLYSLSLINFHEEILYEYLIESDLILHDLLAKQITHLTIDIKNTAEQSSMTVSNIFALIISLCKRLIDLNFCDLFPRKYWFRVCILPFTSYMSSTLIKLKINLVTLTDCLFLLDGRLDCLSTLIVNVSYISSPLDVERTKKLPKLKCFSLTSFNRTNHYEDLVIPLLCRMINLEELKLYLRIRRLRSTYIDGDQLYDEILIHMPRLNKFIFSIDTKVNNMDIIFEFQSNEDIQRSFIRRGYQQVASYIYTESVNTDGRSHIYSLPYEFEYFIVDNCFHDGIFDKVRYLTMDDTIPFEHKFFQLISQHFPFLECLSILNSDPQEDKQHSPTLISFPHLTFLDLQWANLDYAEQFLLKKNAHLPRLLNLCIKYELLVEITNNFTNDTTHFNFSQLKNLDLCGPFVRPENFHQYFVLL